MAFGRRSLWPWIAVGFLAVIGYQIFFVVVPDARRFFQDCHRKGLASVEGKLTDEDYDRIAADCNRGYFARMKH
jgi:hypothetical protein